MDAVVVVDHIDCDWGATSGTAPPATAADPVSLFMTPRALNSMPSRRGFGAFGSLRHLNVLGGAVYSTRMALDTAVADTGVPRAGNLNREQKMSSLWLKSKDPGRTLWDVTLRARLGELVAVVGEVGCGKSSLLLAMLGELPTEVGGVTVKGRIAYVPQEPWIVSGTIRDNIVLSSPFNEQWYQRVVTACCLQTDLDLLAHGDLTEVGDRGVALSGGQRARICLARAAYANADVYLLDDPLSAVGTQCRRVVIVHTPPAVRASRVVSKVVR
jgi:ABC-type multidrug transport system fused ATPase/permease subunit